MKFYKKLLTLIPLILLSACGEEQVPPERMKSGADLYNYYCKSCHEQRGPGANMEHYADREPMKPYKIMLMIKFGYDQRHKMPVFQQLSEEQADAVARHVIQLQMQSKQDAKAQ